MAQFISFQPSDYFNASTYTNTGAIRTISGVGFQPDTTWNKVKNTSNRHLIFNSVAGATKFLAVNDIQNIETIADSLTSWNSDGYVLGADATDIGINYGTTNSNVSWNWKAGTTSGIATNGSTTLTPSGYSFDQTAGCSVIQFTGNITAAETYPHGLGVAPDMIWSKPHTGTYNWNFYHKQMNGGTDPEDYGMKLNTTALQANSDSYWNDTAPDSVNVTLGNSDVTNSSGVNTHWCFAEKTGYSKFGKYKGNGNATNGIFVHCGFRPSWVLLKSYDNAESWTISDTKRDGYNSSNKTVRPANTSGDAAQYMDLFSNGFRITSNNTEAGANNYGYLYAAFAEFPQVASNSVPGVAR